MSKKIDKEYKRREELAEATLALKDAVSLFDKLSVQYTQWADEMAKDGDVEGSDDMLMEKAEMLEFRDIFVAMEKELMRNVTITEAFAGLPQLVKAIVGCKKSFAKMPDLKKLGKDIADTRKAINGAKESLSALRSVIRNPKDKEMVRLFGAKDVVDNKVQQRFEKEKAARDLRLREGLANSTKPVPSDAGAYNMDTNIDAITAMIDAENKKG